jgi:uncharacterized protein
MSNKGILIYHGNCPDGFGAAFSFWKKYGDTIDYLPAKHYDILPDLAGRTVFMADIAFERDVMLDIQKKAKSLTVLDHHLSAQKKLFDLECCHFDMTKSGAVLAWEFCFPNQQVPKLLKYIEDRDLFKWIFSDAMEALLAVDSYERTFEKWDELVSAFEDTEKYNSLLTEGRAISRYNRTLIKLLKEENIHTLNILGYTIPAINCPFFRTEIVTELSQVEGVPFAAGYHFDGKNYVFSLRSSTSHGIDVAEIASKFPGGGGHKHASGFSIENLSMLE